MKVKNKEINQKIGIKGLEMGIVELCCRLSKVKDIRCHRST